MILSTLSRRERGQRHEEMTMPIYEYDCPQCGDFTVLRPMAERDEPCACPYCDTQSARVILSAPGHSLLAGQPAPCP